MTRFRFKLERLLSLIRIKETMKKLEVAADMRKLSLLKRRKEDIRIEIQQLLSRPLGGIDTAILSFSVKKIELIRMEEKKLDGLMEEANRELKKLKGDLIRLSSRRQGLETLRDRNLKEFKLEQSRKAQKELDEAYELVRKVQG